MGIIYKVTNNINGKCYIGKTISSLPRRKSQHMYEAKNERDNFVFRKAIRKYGRENFEWEIIERFNSREEMDKSEVKYIELYDSFYGTGKGYNMTKNGSSGMRGKKHSEETKEKLRSYRHTPEAKEKIRLATIERETWLNNGFTMKGRKHSEETKRRISETTKATKRRNR